MEVSEEVVRRKVERAEEEVKVEREEKVEEEVKVEEGVVEKTKAEEKVKMGTRNKRSQYTEESLKEMLLLELKKKPISRVSVTELCKGARIDRSTFYLHYEDVFALLRSVEEEELSDIRLEAAHLLDSIVPGDKVVEEILLYLRREREKYLVLMREGSPLFWRTVREELQALFKEKLLQQYPQKASLLQARELEDGIAFVTNGFYGIYRRWLESEEMEDMAYIAALSSRLSTACIQELLGPMVKDDRRSDDRGRDDRGSDDRENDEREIESGEAGELEVKTRRNKKEMEGGTL